ncbi:MAG TPA: hypothetical protein VFO07_01930, partial [Roseiflexaceae bacterium]|nr:hypothetical protein [Roseiflexaceae bacterium]
LGGDILLAGTRDGIWRSDDLGQTWADANQGLSIRHVRWLAHHPTAAGLAFAGTEPAGIFVSQDGGATWRSCPEVERLRDCHGWFLPYSPGAGCVRSFAFHGSRIYAAVEIGGVLRSDDLGATWRLVEGSTGNPDFTAPVPRTFLHPDVHEVAVLSASEDVLLAATMQGLYRSLDGGKKWLHLYADCYVRSLWIDPADHQHLIVGPADGVEINGQIEESNDAGWSWHAIPAGLPVPWRRAVVERLTQVGAELFAVVSNGHVFAAPIETLEWRRILSDVVGVAAITAWAPESQSTDGVRRAAEPRAPRS